MEIKSFNTDRLTTVLGLVVLISATLHDSAALPPEAARYVMLIGGLAYLFQSFLQNKPKFPVPGKPLNQEKL
jgi:hypothetical protein